MTERLIVRYEPEPGVAQEFVIEKEAVLVDDAMDLTERALQALYPFKTFEWADGPDC